MHTRFSNMKRGVVALATLGLVAAGFAVNTPAANAVAPGLNGRIVFLASDGGDTFVAMRTGNINTVLPFDLDADDPTWCANRSIIAEVGGFLWEANISPEGFVGMPHLLTTVGLEDPACSPDGTKVAAVNDDEVYVLPLDGSSGGTPIASTASDADAQNPTWSSDGSQIAFVDTGFASIYTVNANGGFPTRRSPLFGGGVEPSWFGSTIYYELGDDTKSIKIGNSEEVNHIESDCNDPAALPDGSGIICVDEDGALNRNGSTQLVGTNAAGPADDPDVESIRVVVTPTLPPAGALEVSPDDIDFGKVKKHKTVSAEVEVTNNTGGPVVLDIDKDGSSAFRLSSSSSCEDGDALAAGDSCDIVVKFKPTSKSTKTADLNVNGITVELEGRGK